MDVDKAVVICIPFDILRLCQMCKITFHLNRTMESFNAVIEPQINIYFTCIFISRCLVLFDKSSPVISWQNYLHSSYWSRVIPFMFGNRQTIETERDPSMVDNGRWFKVWNLWRNFNYLHLKLWISWSKDKVYKYKKEASYFVFNLLMHCSMHMLIWNNI